MTKSKHLKTKAENALDHFVSRLFYFLTGTAFGYLWAFKALEKLQP